MGKPTDDHDEALVARVREEVAVYGVDAVLDAVEAVRRANRVCAACGGPMPPGAAPQRRTCSKACRQRLYRERHPEAQAAYRARKAAAQP